MPLFDRASSSSDSQLPTKPAATAIGRQTPGTAERGAAGKATVTEKSVIRKSASNWNASDDGESSGVAAVITTSQRNNAGQSSNDSGSSSRNAALTRNTQQASSSNATPSNNSNTQGNSNPGNTNQTASDDTRSSTAEESDSEALNEALNALLPENNLANAKPEGSVVFQRSNDLAQNAADLYQFSVEETGVFTATLTNLSADADVQLIQDKNENGQVDSGEVIAWEWERGNLEESIRHFLQPGDYVLRVINQDAGQDIGQDSGGEPTRYDVATTFEAAATDDRAFSINVVYKIGTDQLNEAARVAVERAADYWESVISHSSFDRPLEFALGLYGTTNTSNPFLAYGGPQSYLEADDKLLPIVGVTVLNNLYLDRYNGNPGYLEYVLRHEIGHALGLGTIWDRWGNDLVDQDNNVYRAETYAGHAYGELLGTGIATAVPLDSNSLTHWNEEVFDAELMTPNAEGIGEPLPLSQLTIASLRDLGWEVNFGAAEPFSLNTSSAVA